MKTIAFTIVLNGMPFIRKQAEILPHVFDEWHIIEGATLPVKDTAWCRNINNKFYTSDKKLSVDSTSEFIDEISMKYPNVIVHRKNDFWNGKLEMVQQIESKMADCILMEFDVDEIWNKDILQQVLEFAKSDSMKLDGMLFRCNYYVGDKLILQGENQYGNKQNEWCRLWKLADNKHEWISHEPPKIKDKKWFYSKEFTEQKGWIFDHYAYTELSQLEPSMAF